MLGWNGNGQLGEGPWYPTPLPVQGLRYTLPARLLDTRPGYTTVDGRDAGVGRRDADSVVVLQVGGRAGVPVEASAAVVNVTVIEPVGPGFVTVWPCDEVRPNASNVDFVAGATVANLVVAELDPAGRTCLYTFTGTHLIADVNGYEPHA